MEYASAAFHTCLTADQSEGLERLQRTSLKNIYGVNKSYRECLELSGIERLDLRRERLFRAFAEKCYASERFTERWFPPPTRSGYSLRKEDRVEEKFAACDRLKNAPLYRMRKVLNENPI